jgi:tetratricopeptide (TPR) repeat protein
VELADSAIYYSSALGDSALLARSLMKKGGSYQSLDISDSALIFFKQGLSIAEGIRNDSLVARTKNSIANFYLRQEDYPEAMLYLTDALTIAERIGYRHMAGLVYNGLGLVSISMEDNQKAIEYFKNAREICSESGDLANEAGITMNIAGCYAELGDFGKAYEYYLENLEAQEKLDDTAQIALAYINLGIVARSLDSLEKSMEYLKNALGILSVFRNQSLLSTVLLESGTTQMDAGNLPAARDHLLQSLELSTGTLSRSNSMESLKRLSQLEEELGNMALSLRYYKRYTDIKDSVMNDEIRQSVQEIQWKYDLSKKEYENELLSKKFEIKQRQNTNLRILFISFAVVALLLGILIWLAYKQLLNSYKIKNLENRRLQDKIAADEKIRQLEYLRYRDEIEAKNRELTSTSLQLLNKNKILSDIGELASDLHSEGKMEKVSLKGLQSLIRENQNADKDWEQFKGLFEQVHENFFVHLKSGCPELTENELRLCAYLRINLMNKEIARMLNVSPATVNTSRYRVRKKLKISNKESLEEFLRNI